VAPSKPADQLSPAEREAQALYTTRALEALHQAIDHGFRNLADPEEDPDLRPLRPQPGYRAVVERLQKLPPANAGK
jgi:hypothetical protein